MSRLLLMIPILLVLIGVLFAGHWYVADRLIVALDLPAPFTRVMLCVLALLGLSLVLQPIAERLLARRLARFITWPASIWLGVAFLLLLSLAISELLLFLLAVSAGGAPAVDVTVARWRAVALLCLVLPLALAGLREGLSKPAVRRIEVALPGWPEEADGFRIVQVCDIHLGPILGREFAEWLVERVNRLEPDLIAITGDLVDGSASRMVSEVAPLAGLRARHGVYFVTGNHDHYSGARGWAERIAKLGIRTLRNERVSLELPGGTVELAGVDDHHAGLLPGEHGEDLDLALAGVDATRPLLLLAHDPSIFRRAPEVGVDLQLSGHTHGGQIWPFRYLVRLAIPFVQGLHRRGEAQLYVSRGTAFWGPPMRLGAPAEISEVVISRRRESLALPPRATPSILVE